MDGHDALVACLHLSKSFFLRWRFASFRRGHQNVDSRLAGQCLCTARLLFCLASCLYSSSWVVSTSFFFLDLKKIIIKPRFPWNREFHRSDFPFYLLFFLGAAVHYHTTLSCSLLTLGEKEKENWSSEKLKAFISRSGALLFHIFVLPLGFPSPGGGGGPAVSR